MNDNKSIPAHLTSSPLHQIHFLIHRIEKNIRPANWQVDRVHRPYTVFWYVCEGKKTIKVNDKKYIVQQGDLVVFPAHLPFEIYESSIYTDELVHFEAALESKIGPFDLTKLFRFPIVTKLSEPEQTERLIVAWEKLREEWKVHKENPLLQNGELGFSLKKTLALLKYNSLTLDWFVEVLLTISPDTTELFLTLDSRFHQLFYFIEENLSKKLTLKSLADEVFLSESHLSLLFRKNLQMSPMDYVQKKRMEKAQELLLTSNLPLKEIAPLIGFDDQSQLSRAFKRQFGISPTDYRKIENSI